MHKLVLGGSSAIVKCFILYKLFMNLVMVNQRHENAVVVTVDTGDLAVQSVTGR